MHDSYFPTEDQSDCPFCERVLTHAPTAIIPGAWAAKHWRCIYCLHDWDEIRTPLVTTRYWTPVPAPIIAPSL